MPSGPDLRWPKPSRRLALARAAFFLPAGVCVSLLLMLMPINLLTVQFDWQFEAAYPVVAPFVTLSAFTNYWLALSYGAALVCLLVGGMVAWRKADEPVAWLAGVVLVSFPIVFNLGGFTETWTYYPRVWRPFLAAARDVVTVFALLAIVLFVFIFPDGRLPARWMRWLYLACLVASVALTVLLATLGESDFSELLYSMWMLTILATLAVGLAGQIFRYRRITTPVERQQTKWVVMGLAFLVTGLSVGIALQAVTIGTPSEGIVMLVMHHLQLLSVVLVPVTLAFSILRYRLWDIDRLIHRTILYGVLTVALAGLYLGSVIVLQSSLRAVTGQAQSPIVTVLSTLFIAATAGPLRSRVQSAIDRRFNRRRYNAARTLEAFSFAMRGDSVADLDRLNDQLIGVIQETLEPEKVSLWLRS
jgi:hypothetical protein